MPPSIWLRLARPPWERAPRRPASGRGCSLHQLKHGDRQQVLGELGEELEATGRPDDPALKVVRGSLEYLEKRKEQTRYAQFQGMGYPIGSGAVGSANKLVVETRLKVSGMHWAQEQVNPMVALRNIVCNDRWDEAWSQIRQGIREKTKEPAAAHRAQDSPASLMPERVDPVAAGTAAPSQKPTGPGTPKASTRLALVGNQPSSSNRRPPTTPGAECLLATSPPPPPIPQHATQKN